MKLGAGRLRVGRSQEKWPVTYDSVDRRWSILAEGLIRTRRPPKCKRQAHDRDPLFPKAFDTTIAATGLEPIRTGVCAPDMNAYCERFVQTIRQECLDKLVLTSEAQLRYVLREFFTYYHRERPHQGLGNTIIDPWPQDEGGEILEFERLGGLLRSYRRIKEAA